MFDQLSLGIYYPADSFLHRLRARTKLLALLLLIVFVTAANQLPAWHFAPYGLLVTLVCAGSGLSGISSAHLWRRMWLLALVSIVGVLTTVLFFVDEGAPLYAIGPARISYASVYVVAVTYCAGLALLLALALLGMPAARGFWRRRWLLRTRIGPIFSVLVIAGLFGLIRDTPLSSDFEVGPLIVTEQGVWLGLQLVTVFLSLYALALLLTMTTTPVALIEGLTLLLGPLRRLRLPVDEFALMTLLALRFIPTLTDEVELLIKAQTARGADFTHCSLQERAQSLSTLFVPLLQGTLRRAADLATALDARGYTVDGTQTLLHETALAPADYLVLGVLALATVGALLV
jgi:energy-coupling factor transport system permease protein